MNVAVLPLLLACPVSGSPSTKPYSPLPPPVAEYQLVTYTSTHHSPSGSRTPRKNPITPSVYCLDMVSVVVYMDAPPKSAGAVTRDVPGLAIRMTVVDEVIEDGLDVFYEILGGTPEVCSLLIGGMQQQYQAKIRVNQDRLEAWRANVCFTDLSSMRENPFFNALLDTRFDSERLVLVYEDGMAIYRLDLPAAWTMKDAEVIADRIRDAARRTDPRAVVRLGELARDLEDWQPLTEYQPTA